MPEIARIILGVACLIHCSRAQSKETGNDIQDQSHLSKNGRFITFNNHGEDIRVELDFAVPFLKIPVGGSRQYNGFTGLDVDTKGLVSVGALLVLLVTVVPKVVQLIIPQAQVTTVESLTPIMGRVTEALSASDISTYECYQRASCWIASKTNVNPSESSKGLQWLTGLINDGAIQEAIVRGMNGEGCLSYKCPLSVDAIYRIFKFDAAT